ncbi:calmodulin-beta-like [Drosophila hydei]|uniref:Calmodulin-beta-like n=1 Tax=Drosophila hydei TaxID=7224 RepID=A0A6J1M324_DROHY|nr:calmodulin-beta-like [Drosophila hydei]
MEYTDEELDEFKRAFAILIRDGESRSVTIRDLDAVVTALGKTVTEKELQSMINEMDLDGNGFIVFDNFLHSMTMRMTFGPDEDDIRETFRIFDRDNTGFIGPDQIRNVMLDLDIQILDEECEEMIRVHDFDADGKLSYEEFVQMMTVK